MRLEGLVKAEGLENVLFDCGAAPTYRENAYGIHLLNSLISDEYLPYVRKCATSREAYAALEHMHMGDNITKYSTLMEKLPNLEKKTFTIDQYVNYTSDLQRDLVGAGETFTEQAFCVALLKGLPAEYDTVKQMMREKKPERLTLESLRHTLKRREYDISVEGPSSASTVPSVTVDAKALHALFGMGDKGGKGAKDKFQKKGKGKGKQGGKFNATNNGNKGNKGKQGDKPKGKARKGTVCWNCGMSGHFSRDCKNKSKDGAQGHANSAMEVDPVFPPHLMQ